MLFDASATYERLVAVRDAPSGLRAVVAIDSTRRGPAFGGIRRRHYESEAAAVADACSLARAMSRKCALADLAAGGAKTVVLMPAPGAPDPRWPKAYHALGRAIDELGGRYVAGPDVGTGPEELAHVRSMTSHVNPAGNDAGASTAAGVLAGLRAIWEVLGLRPGPRVRVAIAGLGAVGSAVARSLCADGVRVCGADPDAEAASHAASHGVEIVAPERILAEPCDVLVPCAMGQVFDVGTVAALSTSAICGSANDQLVDDAAAWALHGRGIVHAPDIVVSAGAVIEGVLTVAGGQGDGVRAEVLRSIERIAETLHAVLQRSRADDVPPAIVAHRTADAVLGEPPTE